MIFSYKMGNFQPTENGIKSSSFLLKIRKTKKYGCIPDINDQRDIWVNFPKKMEYYQNVDLRKTKLFPEIYDQGSLGSSTAHAVLACYIFSLRKHSLIEQDKKLSPQFIYFNQRVVSGTTDYDSGACIRDAIKVISRIGVCEEHLYPYNVDYFIECPNKTAYENAYNELQQIEYKKIGPSVEDIMKCISNNIPVILGFTVYDSFEHADVSRTGVMPEPKHGEKIVGSHAVLIVGYDFQRSFFLCRNSWGEKWGQSGHFWMPFRFVNSRNCNDLWVMSVSNSSSRPGAKLVQNSHTNSGVVSGGSVHSGGVTNAVKSIGNEVQSTVVKKPEIIIEKVPEFKDDTSDVEIPDEEDTVY